MSVRHSSRKRRLKLPTKAFCVGLPGSMQCHSTTLCWHPAGSPSRSAVVKHDRVWSAAPADDGIQFSSNAHAGQRSVGDKREAFSCVVVDQREHPEPPTIGESVGNDRGSTLHQLDRAPMWACACRAPAFDHRVNAPAAFLLGRGAAASSGSSRYPACPALCGSCGNRAAARAFIALGNGPSSGRVLV